MILCADPDTGAASASSQPAPGGCQVYCHPGRRHTGYCGSACCRRTRAPGGAARSGAKFLIPSKQMAGPPGTLRVQDRDARCTGLMIWRCIPCACSSTACMHCVTCQEAHASFLSLTGACPAVLLSSGCPRDTYNHVLQSSTSHNASELPCIMHRCWVRAACH